MDGSGRKRAISATIPLINFHCVSGYLPADVRSRATGRALHRCQSASTRLYRHGECSLNVLKAAWLRPFSPAGNREGGQPLQVDRQIGIFLALHLLADGLYVFAQVLCLDVALLLFQLARAEMPSVFERGSADRCPPRSCAAALPRAARHLNAFSSFLTSTIAASGGLS